MPNLAHTPSQEFGMGLYTGVKRGSFALVLPIGAVSALSTYRHPASSLGAGFSFVF